MKKLGLKELKSALSTGEKYITLHGLSGYNKKAKIYVVEDVGFLSNFDALKGHIAAYAALYECPLVVVSLGRNIQMEEATEYTLTVNIKIS